MTHIRCWWFGCEPHPQNPAPPDELTCDHCGKHVPYSDLVGDTRHIRMMDRLHWLRWKLLHSWRPKLCDVCGKKECDPDCGGPIPF